MRALCSLFCCFGLLTANARAITAPIAEIPFDFRDGLLWIKVASDKSSQPLTFLLDSGATVSVIDSRTAKRLNLERGNRVKVRGVHTSAAGYWPARLDANLGNISLPKKYLVTDLSALSKVCHSRIDGLLGADFFSSHIVQIDFSAALIRILSRTQPDSATEILPLRSKTGRLQVPVRVNDSEPKWVRVDTGCTSELQWVFKKALAPSLGTTRSVGLSKCSFPTTHTDVRLNNTRFENVLTGVHSTAIFPGEHGLLGTGLLSRFQKITFDTQSGRLLLDR
jgi:predicted aspartyl protease